MSWLRVEQLMYEADGTSIIADICSVRELLALRHFVLVLRGPPRGPHRLIALFGPPIQSFLRAVRANATSCQSVTPSAMRQARRKIERSRAR